MTIIFALGGGSGTPAGNALCERAAILFANLDAQNDQIIIPTVVVSELLAGIPSKNHGSFLSALQAKFRTHPLDLQASALAAQLFQRHRGLPKSEQASRTVLKADVLIIASAKVAGAEVFYSHDQLARSLASTIMTAKDLPITSELLFLKPKIGALLETAHDLAGGDPKPKSAPKRKTQKKARG